MSASARRAALLWLLMAGGPASAGEASRLDLTRFLTPDAAARPLRGATGPAIDPTGLEVAKDGVMLSRPGTPAFEPNFDRLRKVWMPRRPPPPLAFREPFPRRRSIQDRRSEGVAVVIRSVGP